MISQIQKLVEQYQAYHVQKEIGPDIPTIKVDKVAVKIASLFERIRDLVDWQEEHLLRRSAVVRILRRRLVLRAPNEPLADLVVKDLIRGGYFPNGKIPESKISDARILLNKYLFVIDRFNYPNKKQARIFKDWLLDIAACEIEALLDPLIREEALIEYMVDKINKGLKIKNERLIVEKENLIFVGVCQALFKLEPSFISYQLIKKFVPGWSQLKIERDAAVLEEFIDNLPKWHEKITKLFFHPFGKKFYWLCENFDTPFLILGDVINDAVANKEIEKLDDLSKVDLMAMAKYRMRLANQRKKAERAAFFSTVSIFLGKMLLAFAFEMPFDIYITKEFDLVTLGLNIAIPPVLMGILVVFGLKSPSSKNEARVLEEVKKLYVGEASKYEIILPLIYSISFKAFLGLLYFIGTIITFSAIIYSLTKLHFSYFSQLIFIFFISLIAYSGSKIRQRSRELVIEEPTAGFFQSVGDFFTLSILELGRWLSGQLVKIKPVAVLFNILIELPVHFFIDFIEQWRIFLKEKKEKIIR
jgi:hypothetical protein